MTKPLKIGGSVNETFNLGASTKKSSADQKIFQNRCRRRPTIGRRRPIFPFWLTDCRATVGLGNVTVVLFGEGQVRYKGHNIDGKSDRLRSHCWSRVRMSFNIRERETSYR